MTFFEVIETRTKLRFIAGSEIGEAKARAMQFAVDNNTIVEFDFNGTVWEVFPPLIRKKQ